MTNEKLVQYCTKNQITIKDACEKFCLNYDVVRMQTKNVGIVLMNEYRNAMARMYSKKAIDKEKQKKSKKRKNSKTDVKFRCPCGKCRTVGSYCPEQYYKEVTGKESREVSFDSVFKPMFSTYGALA